MSGRYAVSGLLTQPTHHQVLGTRAAWGKLRAHWVVRALASLRVLRWVCVRQLRV